MKNRILHSIFLVLIWQGPGWIISQGYPMPIWQGFKQEWGYNHRLNRLGDWYQLTNTQENPVEWFHAAASGSGADSCHFETYNNWIKNPYWTVTNQPVTLRLEGKEGDTIRAEGAVKLPLDNMAYAYWINGFDIGALDNQGADKLQYLKVTTEPRFSIEENQALYKVAVEAVFNCSTLECDNKNEVGYQFTAVLGLIRWDDLTGFTYENDTLTWRTEWDKLDQKDTLLPHLPITGGDGGVFFYPLIRGFEISIDPEVHYQALGFGLKMEPRSRENIFVSEYKPFFLFRTGSEAMWEAYREYFEGKFRPPGKWVVKQSNGKAEIRLFIQKTNLDCSHFGNSQRYDQGHSESHLIWHTTHGNQQSAFSPSAIHHQKIDWK